MKASLLTIVALLVIVSIPTWAQKDLNKTFTGVKQIKMSSSSGSCQIRKSSNATVTVAMKNTYDEDDGYEVRVDQEGDVVLIEERFRSHNVSGSVQWTLTVPDGLKIRFTTGSGDLDVTDVNVDLRGTSGSGDLTFTNSKGRIDANTGSGDVELGNYTGEIKLNTGSGNMRIEKAEGEVDLNCGSGDIRIIDTKGSFSINTGSGDIKAEKVTLTGSSRFNTGSGRAEVAVASTPKFDLSINSGSGTSTLDYMGNEIAGEIVMRASKRNGRITAPFEFDKTEETESKYGNDVTVTKTAVKGNSNVRISIGTGSGDAVLKK